MAPGRANLEPFLCGNPDVHVYAIGDLDPSCWDDCTWHGLREGGELRAVALTYRGLATPVVQAARTLAVVLVNALRAKATA